MTERPPDAVVAAFGLEGARFSPIDVGLINLTLRVDRGAESFILQRLHPVFSGEVNLDIEAVTERLAARGLVTPRLVRAVDGRPFVEADGPWRVLTFVPGRVVDTVRSPAMARSAAALVARFHAALDGFEHRFAFTRPGAHDTPRRLAHLEAALATHASHRLLHEVEPVARAILAHGQRLPEIGALPRRIVHGDLKITNVLFDEPLERAVALIDLDTLAHGTLAVELGDALRSWCNPAGESAPAATVDEAIFVAAVQGYASEAGAVAAEERDAIVAGAETIALELASRFCADALEERYFGWDCRRFATRGEHCLARARSQASLASSIRDARPRLQEAVTAAFGAG